MPTAAPPTAIPSQVREQMARLAHELNAPLSVVTGSLSTLEHYILALVRQSASSPALASAELAEGEDVVGKVLALLQLCKEGTRRLEHVARQLRSCGGAPAEQWEAVDLAAVLEQAIRFARPDRDGRDCVSLGLPPGLPPVRGSAESLGQVFVNLVRNALEAVEGEAEPRVCIQVRVLESAEVDRADAPGPWVEISVRDNGPGVPAEVRPHLFEPFRSTKGSGGMGLGLAIAHDVVQQHGGTIALASGSGADFRVRLPLEDTAAIARL